MSVNNNQPPLATTVPPVVTNTPDTTPVVTTPATTAPVNPVAAALTALLRHDNVEKLWKENVTDAPWYKSFFGRIYYFFNKSTALEKDRVAIDFENKARELVVAVANRRLTKDEARENGIPSVKFSNTNDQMAYFGFQKKAEKALNDFYAVFKARVTQINTNNGLAPNTNYVVYAAAAQNLLTDLQNKALANSKSEFSLKLEYPEAFEYKMGNTKLEFDLKIFNDMVTDFAKSPIDHISVEIYKAKFKELREFFPNLDKVEVDYRLRQAIKNNHSAADIADAIETYSNPNRLRTLQAELENAERTALADRLTSLEAELLALCGPTGFDGELNQISNAYLPAAINAENAARSDLVSARLASGESVRAAATSTDALTASRVARSANENDAILRCEAALENAINERVRLEQLFDAKRARLNELATFDQHGQVNGGLVFDARRGAIDQDAIDARIVSMRAEARTLVDFYTELNNELSDDSDDKVERFRAMRDIIGEVTVS
jgi:hypothetical protein